MGVSVTLSHKSSLEDASFQIRKKQMRFCKSFQTTNLLFAAYLSVKQGLFEMVGVTLVQQEVLKVHRGSFDLFDLPDL